MGGNISSALETQQRKFGMIANVCCSDKSYDLPNSGDNKLLVRHIRQGKSSKYAARSWRSDPCHTECTQSDNCLYCATEEGQEDKTLIFPANRRDLDRAVGARRPLTRISTKNQGRAEPPVPSVARPIKSLPGWHVSEVEALMQAVEVTAHALRIKPPNYTEIQVHATAAILQLVRIVYISLTLAFLHASEMILVPCTPASHFLDKVCDADRDIRVGEFDNRSHTVPWIIVTACLQLPRFL
jgi:hypothetical protein